MSDTAQTARSLRSMTGFAAFSGEAEGWRFQGDIRAVNGRGLDLRLRLPEWVEGLEQGVRAAVKGRISRGSVTISARVSRDESQGATALNAAALKGALTILREIEAQASEAGLPMHPMRATDIAAMRGVIETSDAGEAGTAALGAAMLAEIDRALDAFDADRLREGAELAGVLAAQIDQIETLTAEAVRAAGDRAAAARAAMERGLARLLEATDVPDEARLTQELALIAVKSDVTEELDRLTAHVSAARGLMSETVPVGRKLDFLMQEFNREANTLCSKAQSPALTAIGLDLKAVIDQMREQVQNIE